MVEKINKPRENPDVDSRMSYEEEQTQIDLLRRSGLSIDYKTGTIRAKKFIGSGEGLWDVGEGTGTGPKGDDGDKGDKGDQGDQGIPGEDGEKGDKGDKGDTGDKGADGADVDSIQLDAIQAELDKQTADISKNAADIAAHDVRDNGQDTLIAANKASIDAIEPIVTQNTADIADNTADIIKLGDDIANAPSIDAYTKSQTDTLLDDKANVGVSYTKAATDTLLDSKANVGDSYTKAETYSNVETDTKLFTKADKDTTYTKDEVDTIVGEGGGDSGSGGDSVWTNLNGDAVLTKDDKNLTVDANVGELGLKSKITTDTNSLEIKVGSGGLPDVTVYDNKLDINGTLSINGVEVETPFRDMGAFTECDRVVAFTEDIYLRADHGDGERYMNILAKAPLKDGVPDYDETFGISIDLDEGDTSKCTFKIANQYGSIFRVKSGENPQAFYVGQMTNSNHIATVGYVKDYQAALESRIKKLEGKIRELTRE